MTTLSYNPNNLDEWWESRQTEDNKQWVRISAEAGELVRTQTGREDLIAVVEPGYGKGAPAVYVPENARIEVDPEICAAGVNPRDIHIDTEVGQLEHPGFVGAIDHEGGHAENSLWPIDQAPAKRRVVQAALLIEEPCMERDVVLKRPHRRVFLRATFHNIVNRGNDPIETVAGAAHMAALVGGRVDAGVLEAHEVAPILDTCKTVLGERYDGFRQIWLDGMAIPVRDDAAVMEALGQRWLDLLGDDATDDGGEGDTIVFVCGQEPGEGQGEGEGQNGEGQGMVKEVAEAVSESAADEAADQVDAAKVRDIVDARKADAREQEKDETAAADVFRGKIKFVGHGYGHGSEGLRGQRPATANEHAQANVLGRAIQKAQHRERVKTTHSSALPPGRLRGSKAVRRSAEKSMGMMATTEPWRQTQRRHIDNPPINVGIACDISGSMSWATDAVASAAWVIAHAVHRNEGDAAVIAYGEKVHAVVRPGENPETVREFNANGGMENWTEAMRSLNGALWHGHTGARLAVFISDGHYTQSQHANGNKMVAKLMRDGVKVLWIGFHGDRAKGGRDTPPAGVEYVQITDPSRMGVVIGAAMVRLLNKA